MMRRLQGLAGWRLLPATIVVAGSVVCAKVAGLVREATASAQTQEAIAAPPSKDRAAAAAPQVAAAPAPSAASAGSSATPAVSPSELLLLQDLRKRRDALDARQHQLDEREAVVQAMQQTLQARLDKLSAVQAAIDKHATDDQKADNQNWSRLVTVYEDMKPRDAAAIFDVLDMHVLLEVLGRMNERKAAGVLAAMQPERARMATQMLAQRRVQSPVVSVIAASPAPPKQPG
jgi:flagellar motility protein MotE (MotC chaperone)